MESHNDGVVKEARARRMYDVRMHVPQPDERGLLVDDLLVVLFDRRDVLVVRDFAAEPHEELGEQDVDADPERDPLDEDPAMGSNRKVQKQYTRE